MESALLYIAGALMMGLGALGAAVGIGGTYGDCARHGYSEGPDDLRTPSPLNP